MRSADEPLPACHALNDIPFERAIQDGLKLMAIHKPKLIQAHVWETILRGRDVTFVGARRTGKTLGTSSLDPSEFDFNPTVSWFKPVVCPRFVTAL